MYFLEWFEDLHFDPAPYFTKLKISLYCDDVRSFSSSMLFSVAISARLLIISKESSIFPVRFSFQSFLPASVRRDIEDFFSSLSSIDASVISVKCVWILCSRLLVARRIRCAIHEKICAAIATKKTQRKYTSAIIPP
jgi:hypothetical protein